MTGDERECSDFFWNVRIFFGGARNEAGVGGEKREPKWAPYRGRSMGSWIYVEGLITAQKSDNLMAE
ncbi:MAG TPA: hypothetical protein DEO44_04345 [Verrucomicrobia subdivision 6 bacterium]|nr:hypothetical protein [Verrucomicrobia subdivision 6 bacterium]